MRKIIKVMLYLDTDEEDKMNMLVKDVKNHLLALNNLWETHGLHTIKVTTTGFDAKKDCFKGGWGIETPVGTRER